MSDQQENESKYESFDEFCKLVPYLMRGRFKSKPWFNRTGQILEYYFEDKMSYAERVHQNLHLIKDGKTDEIIGFQIWDFYHLMQKTFDKEFADKIQEMVEEWCNKDWERQEPEWNMEIAEAKAKLAAEEAEEAEEAAQG